MYHYAENKHNHSAELSVKKEKNSGCTFFAKTYILFLPFNDKSACSVIEGIMDLKKSDGVM